jgi:hypothetical protein
MANCGDKRGAITADQLAWLREASEAAGEISLSDWLRKLATEAAEKQLGTSFEPSKPRKR